MSNYDWSLTSANERKSDRRKFSNDGCIEGFHIATAPAKIREKFPLPSIPHGSLQINKALS